MWLCAGFVRLPADLQACGVFELAAVVFSPALWLVALQHVQPCPLCAHAFMHGCMQSVFSVWRLSDFLLWSLFCPLLYLYGLGLRGLWFADRLVKS